MIENMTAQLLTQDAVDAFITTHLVQENDIVMYDHLRTHLHALVGMPITIEGMDLIWSDTGTIFLKIVPPLYMMLFNAKNRRARDLPALIYSGAKVHSSMITEMTDRFHFAGTRKRFISFSRPDISRTVLTEKIFDTV